MVVAVGRSVGSHMWGEGHNLCILVTAGVSRCTEWPDPFDHTTSKIHTFFALASDIVRQFRTTLELNRSKFDQTDARHELMCIAVMSTCASDIYNSRRIYGADIRIIRVCVLCFRHTQKNRFLNKYSCTSYFTIMLVHGDELKRPCLCVWYGLIK